MIGPTMTQQPLPVIIAWRGVVRCVATSVVMLTRRQIRWPREHVGRLVRFADGTAAEVYRDTVVARQPADPCVLVVAFRLRWVRGRGHALFRVESILNTPLFVGFPGFVAKLWLAHDSHGVYRGLYEWDGAGRAEGYARSLWRVLALVSERGTIAYHVAPAAARRRRTRRPDARTPGGRAPRRQLARTRARRRAAGRPRRVPLRRARRAAARCMARPRRRAIGVPRRRPPARASLR